MDRNVGTVHVELSVADRIDPGPCKDTAVTARRIGRDLDGPLERLYTLLAHACSVDGLYHQDSHRQCSR